MRIGKFTNEQLKDMIFSHLKNSDDILLGSGVGEDCAALDFNGEACVLSTDPITGACENVGSLAVHVSGNDIASSGAKPSAMLVTLLIPPEKEMKDVQKVVAEIIKAADSLGINIIGGHTEVTDAVRRIVVSTTVVGRTKSSDLIKSSGARQGDAIIMTKYAAVEGTFIIASEHSQRLKKVLSQSEYDMAIALGSKLSVIKEGITAGKLGATAMHDITEGGVLGAVHEICEASGIGCELYKEKIPVLDVTKKICEEFCIDAYRLIGSGSMLITTPDEKKIVSALEKNGVKATVIGKITGKEICLVENGQKSILCAPGADELFNI